MLTARGWWFLIVLLLMLVIGAFITPYFSVVPALVSLTLLAWFVWEWALFHARSNGAVSRLGVTRHVLQGGREVPMVWAGLGFEVRVSIKNPGSFSIPFGVFEDRAAVATEIIAGSKQAFARLEARESLEIVYTLRCPAPGVLRFEGVRVRVADFQGFFYRHVFLRVPVEMLVLPPLTDDKGRQRATKRFNTLPPPGIHRLRRPGSGSELLDLRDYRPGDPPKMIAWKASARRDRLITKEFESDVPVRAVLFLDTSEGVRLGPPGNTLLTRLASVAAAVSQAAAGNRDLFGLTTFDETEAKVIPPARTQLHMINVLRQLAEVSALQPSAIGVPPEQLIRRANPLAHEVYPELMTKKINSLPFSRLWIPLLDRKYGWVILAMILLSPLLLMVKGWTTGVLNFAGARTPAPWPFLLKVFWFFLVFAVSIFPPATFALIFWGLHGVRGWFGIRRRELTRRKQLSALFAIQDGTGASGVEHYIADDTAFANRVSQFLQRHLLRCPVPLYDTEGRYRFRCPAKATVLANAMVRAVSRARDNELYVILADLAELGPDLMPLVRACRVACARHHHVLVIVPWPSDVPPPDHPIIEVDESMGIDPTVAARAKTTGQQKGKTPSVRQQRTVLIAAARRSVMMRTVRDSLTKQYHELFRNLRRELGRVGGTVMRVNDGDPVQHVLDRLDRLRGMRSRR